MTAFGSVLTISGPTPPSSKVEAMSAAATQKREVKDESFISVLRSERRGCGVDHAVEDVHGEVRGEHRECDEQGDRLDHRVVILSDGTEQQRADAGVREHQLSHQG